MAKKDHHCPCKDEIPDRITTDREPERIITLVHGTFARHASWTHEGLLNDTLGGIKGVLLNRFCWSGGNSHTDRLEAGRQLADHLIALAEKFKNAKLFIVSHSHGGNVAMYALKHLEEKRIAYRINGVVTLATPFITLRRRRLHPAVPIAVFTLALLGTLEFAFHALNENTSTGLDQTILPIITLLFGLWIAGSVYSILRYRREGFGFLKALRVLFRIGDTEEFITNELTKLRLRPVKLESFGPAMPKPMILESNPDNQNEEEEQSIGEAPVDQMYKLFVVRPLGDEASMGLVVSQFFSWALNLILAGIGGFVSGFRRVGWFSWTWKLALVFLMAIYLNSQLPSSAQKIGELGEYITSGTFSYVEGWVGIQTVEIVGYFFLAVFWGLLALYVFFGFFSLIGLLVLLFSSTPFGPDAMFWNHFASITAEATPPGPARVYLQSPPPQPEGGQPRRLAHSSIYKDEEVIAEIRKWIEEWGEKQA